AEDGIRDFHVTGVQTCALPIFRTKTKDAVTGTNIYIEGGGFQFQEPIQTAEGSNFLVKNLFYNVPARRKFLKNNNVEFRHIIDRSEERRVGKECRYRWSRSPEE